MDMKGTMVIDREDTLSTTKATRITRMGDMIETTRDAITDITTRISLTRIGTIMGMIITGLSKR